MAYPTLEQYNQAFQLHSRLLTDPELRSGTVATSGLGLPFAISGGFALTYTIKVGSRKFAVRCFHRESKALELRYEAVSKRIASLRSPYFLDFQFQPKGIKVEGQDYPIVKMAWARGETLGEFLDGNHNDLQALASLSTSLERLAAFLEKEKIAHGDLQTGNLMVSDGGSTVQLIDYDGMYVDEIKGLGSSELGHVNFQHPRRKLTNPFDATLDRFSLISLWLALKALREDSSVWDKTKSEVDAIVFRANDFVDPASSSCFALLSACKPLANDVQNFAHVCVAALEKVPSLNDFIAGRNIPASSTSIQITGLSSSNKPKHGYIGAYDVLSALDYEACLRRVGDKIEVVGRIVEVKFDKARNRQPYVFINFGNWRGRIFKIAIWSEGLAAIHDKPEASWVGKWVSVIGLMEPPYVSHKYNYSHLSITVTTVGQMTVLSEEDAQWRLAGPGNSPVIMSTSPNSETLEKIQGQRAMVSSPTSVRSTPTPTSSSASGVVSSNKAILDKIRASRQAVPAPQVSRPISSPLKPVAHSPSPPARPHQAVTRPPEPRIKSSSPSVQPDSSRRVEEKGILARLLGWLFS